MSSRVQDAERYDSAQFLIRPPPRAVFANNLDQILEEGKAFELGTLSRITCESDIYYPLACFVTVSLCSFLVSLLAFRL